MPYLVPAAQQLIDQVSELTKGKVEVLDDVDGFGFQRSIRLTPAAAKDVGDALEAIGDDRIEEIVKSSHGMRVTFVADARADQADPFPITEAKAVLEEG